MTEPQRIAEAGGVSDRRVTTSPEYWAALQGRISYPVGVIAMPGYFKLRWPGKNDPWHPVQIVEVCPTDEDSGELVGDVRWECTVKGEPVTPDQVWPFAGRFPISKETYDAMMQQPNSGQNAPPQVVAERAIPNTGHMVPMPDRMQSEDIGELAKALAKAQGEVEGAVKDAANPAFKNNGRASSYATLASVWDACRKALSGNGLAVTQTTRPGDGNTVTMVTTLMHGSGQWIRGELTVKPTKSDAQGLGSAITYARRYALAAMVGVAPEDDDGEGAVGRQTQPEYRNGRNDDDAAAAAEFANGLMAEIERTKTTGFLVELMTLDRNKKGMAKLEDKYPDLYQQVRNIQQRQAQKLTKAAA
ncbi:MAG TPA: ERF family protein [Ramlibacter sp.]|nr:ERF family protein [Ramlibacter sp.]